jgi:molybdopterin molybdotransferase
MLEYEEALARILERVAAPHPERIPLTRAHGRILAERIVAPIDLPPFDNSAVDGFALRSADVRGASPGTPVALNLRGRVVAGERFDGQVDEGACVRILTGSPLPKGADAVAMQEDTEVVPAGPGKIYFLDEINPWENIRFHGEDVSCGSLVGEPGGELKAGRIPLLAALGRTEVLAGRRPLVGVVATGSELTEAGQPLKAGAIYESNRTALAVMLAEAGAEPVVYPLVRDTLEETQRALGRAFAECDFVVTTGGASVGDLDFIKQAFTTLGGDLQFWRVAIKPGNPFVFGRLDAKLLFGLPGNPVSAFVTFLLLVRPAVRRWQGAVETGLPRRSGRLADTLSNLADRRHFVRVNIDDGGKVHSTGAQASHMLSSLASANALLDMSPRATLDAGAAVSVLFLG